MPITSDYSVFLKGCIKNNAVDYQKLYEEQLLKNSELQEKCNELVEYKESAEEMVSELNEIDEEYNKIEYEEIWGYTRTFDMLYMTIKGFHEENRELKKHIVSIFDK